jgi:RNA polymerase sigma-70 factor (ECF subfamily)
MSAMPLTPDDLSELYERHAVAVVAFFTRRTYDPELAVELMAETFATAVLEASRFRGGGSDDEVTKAAWLYAIARHQLSGWLRRARVERRALTHLGLQAPVLSDAELERVVELADTAGLRADISASLGRLSPGLRDAVRLRVVEERSYPEVAATLGISEQTARARVSRALRSLSRTLTHLEPEANGA